MSYYEKDGRVKQEIYVDARMKICDKRAGARIARYNKEYDLYVVDKPGQTENNNKKSVEWN